MVTKQDAEELQESVQKAYESLDINSIKKKLSELEADMQKPDFWDDQDKARDISSEQSLLSKRVTFWEGLRKKAADIVELLALNDESLHGELETQYVELGKIFSKARTELYYDQPYDQSDAYLTIHAGAGGTDAQDWADMLLRMYVRWAEREGCKTGIIEKSSGDEAGIKSATLEIRKGSFLYGRLKAEQGVHRLVRLSPFNADNLRQTSFAKVDVMPIINSPETVELDQKDLKIDVYRSGGKGGQSVNTTDSAVRITHLPTGIVVAIQNERSQLQNKETALSILRSKLAQLMIEQHKEKLSEIKGPNEQAAWGNQIRNYVLHPYSLVKDTRTKHETNNVQAVLDGDIEEFIEAYTVNSVA